MRVLIELEAPTDVAGAPDRFQRLRMLLKSLLRNYGLRCVRISEVNQEEDGR